MKKMLEEQHIFPVIRKQGGVLQGYADTLTEQHQRGREITDYVLAATNASKISTVHIEPLAKSTRRSSSDVSESCCSRTHDRFSRLEKELFRQTA